MTQQNCQWCNTSIIPIDVHGHYQCPNCKINIDPCCSGEHRLMIMIQLCSLVTPNVLTNNQIKKNTKKTSKPKKQQVPLMER